MAWLKVYGLAVTEEGMVRGATSPNIVILQLIGNRMNCISTIDRTQSITFH